MRVRILLIMVLATVCAAMLTGCRVDLLGRQAEVREVILGSQAWWNDGDIPQYMEAYWKSPDLRFVSGDKVTLGWQKTLDGYLRRYPDHESMGRLVYRDLEITILSDEAALAFGAWRLEREQDRPHGHFTLFLRRFDDGWKIVYDHTSSAE